MKDFDTWNNLKKNIHQRNTVQYANEREVWWCSLGLNIGFEMDGKNKSFERPVVILKKFNKNAYLIVPLSTTKKQGKYYYPIIIDGVSAKAILSQIRFIDVKRLINKVDITSQEKFKSLQKAIWDINTPNSLL